MPTTVETKNPCGPTCRGAHGAAPPDMEKIGAAIRGDSVPHGFTPNTLIGVLACREGDIPIELRVAGYAYRITSFYERGDGTTILLCTPESEVPR